jgi:hypothetical protein
MDEANGGISLGHLVLGRGARGKWQHATDERDQ